MNKQAKLKQDQDVAKDDLTIILSYPHVYRFKPICYGMIVAVLNCHSSVITIMEKNDNILCINYTIKTGHKNASNTADKHPHTPAKASRRPRSAPLPHPGLRGEYTRVSSGFASCF